MNKKDEIKIEVLSNIDDEIIERQTEKRFRLITKNKYSRKKLAGWIGAAASAVAACFLFFTMLFPLLQMVGAQVPIYEGMTVSNTMPTAQIETASANTPMMLSLGEREPSALYLSESTDAPEATATAPETVALPESITVDGADRSLYYANKNEDIYITIHINNPEEFEILSFTLNGLKYQSYMFEEGSNSEALILKVNVGDVEGMIEYTIDAIKYVDGSEIKDVRMDGERTVWIGVCPDDQPTTEIENKSIGTEVLSFDVSLDDVHSLINGSDGQLFAALYKGDKAIETVDVSTDEASHVEFSALTPGEEYTWRIIACYDALDGKGFEAHILYEEIFRTGTHVQITDAAVTGGVDISFELITADDSVVIEKIEALDKGGSVIRSVDASARVFEHLPLGSYTVKVTYKYGADASKTGYAYSSESLDVLMLGSLDSIVKNARIVKEFSGDMQVWNKTTRDYRSHRGIDVETNDADKSVYIPFSGTVTDISGSKVTVKSADNPAIKIVFDSLINISVGIGDEIAFGQKIGEIGRSMVKEAAESEHLHLEVVIDGEHVDPKTLFS